MPLFPALEPYATHQLAVGDGHTLYVEECGNPNGKPALVLHGGPGSGCTPDHRRRFNPAVWRIICFDQRGCGRSTPPAQGPLHANTTQHMVADNETIRQHLGVEAWALVYGTSWGSALAMAYAQTHPRSVQSIVLSAVFLPDEPFTWEWPTHPYGMPLFFPLEFAKLRQFSPTLTGLALVRDLVRQGPEAIHTLVCYEALAAELNPSAAQIDAYYRSPHGARNALIQANAYARQCDLAEGQLLRDAPKIAHLPIHILQGMQDMVCPPNGAYRLAEALKAAGGKPTLTIVPACGHRATEAMEEARVAAIAALAEKI